jgi:hypothetical protein
MADLFGDQLLLGVELGVRTTPHLYVGMLAEGGYGGAGPAATGVGCSALVRCDSGTWTGRLGMELRYHFAPYAPLDPWMSYGVALSAAEVSGHDALGYYSRTLTGVEYGKLGIGVDLRLSRSSAVGLYAEWTRGVFTHLTDREQGLVVGNGGLVGSSTYSWFTVGPRLRF